VITPATKKGLFANTTNTQKGIFGGLALLILGGLWWFFGKKKGDSKSKK
jgi:LPXTG-motif cell wall-anchored protein